MSNNELILDIINRKRDETEKCQACFLEGGNDLDASLQEERKEILDELFEHLKDSDNAFKELKDILKKLRNKGFVNIELSKVYKINIIKKLIYEYKKEYKKTFIDSKIVGIKGLFDNALFCDIIKRRIDKHKNCNMITKNTYEHEVAFLQEFLLSMEKSKNPLKTLSRKVISYKSQKRDECVRIRENVKPKIFIVEEVLQIYREEKNVRQRCK